MAINYSSDIIHHITKDLININNCGELRQSIDSHVIRPKGRKDYQLIYICDGCCYVGINDKTITANKGDIILYRPDEVQNYYYSGKDNSHTYWIHFSGNNCKKMFDDLSLNDVYVISSIRNRDIEYLIAAICKYFNLKIDNYPVICSGMITSVLALISNDLHNAANRNSNRNAGLISELISSLKLLPNLEINLADYAKSCGISQSHFARIFKNSIGESPQQYIIKLRIERAKELLAFTDKNIYEISEATGFKDQNYFSRIFKKNVGITPSQYRKQK